VTWITYKHYKQKTIQSEEFQEQFGTLVEGMNLSTTIGVFWNSLILIRWSVTNLVILLIADHPEFQILLLLVLSAASQGCQLVGHPLEKDIDHWASLFGEFMVSAYLYVMLMLTDFHAEENLSRDSQGQVLVIIVAISVLVNILKFFYQIINECRLLSKRRQLRLEMERRERERLE
jgi:hypothetical protein